MYYFTNPNKFTNRNRFFLDRNTSVRISEGVLYWVKDVGPGNSPDLSLIENLWALVKQRLSELPSARNVDVLKKQLKIGTYCTVVIAYKNTVIRTIFLVTEFLPIVLHYKDIGYMNIVCETLLSFIIKRVSVIRTYVNVLITDIICSYSRYKMFL